MTDVQHVPTPSAPEGATGRHSPVWLIAAFAAAVVVAVTIGIVLTRDGSSAGAQQLTSTEGACQQWTGSYAPSGGSATRAWCTDMTNWMRQQLHSGHMTGSMMFSDATTMRSTCRQWMSTGRAAASGVSPQACDDMVTWMAQHAGNWADWMMTGRMMSQGP